MTMARIQQSFRKLGVNLGYYNGKEIWPRNITARKIPSKLHNNHFCSIWKSERVNFNQVIKDMKDYFKIVDNYITEESVNSHFEYIYTPKKMIHI